MTALEPQLELDFALGHSLPWLKVSEIAQSLDVSEEHVCDLFAGQSQAEGWIDFVVDIRTPGTARPYYRVLRESWQKFRGPGGRLSEASLPNYEIVLQGYLRRLPQAMGTRTVADFFRVSENHILSLTAYFLDAGAGAQRYFRASKGQLLDFIHQRRVS